MNSNSCFYIGNDHHICEDYALEGGDDYFTYAIVSDGCSASESVDFGARVLAMSAKKVLKEIENGNDLNAEEFGEEAIQNAAKVIDIFQYLSYQCLDATLLVAWVQNKNLRIYAYGDGMILHRKKNDTKIFHIHLTSNAPDYLSYNINVIRRKQYNELKDNKKEVWISYDGIHDYKPFDPFVYEFPVEEGDVISLISDGINSFRKADYTPIPWQELVDEFTLYKNFEGEFVLRRISAFKRKCLKEGWVHSDDISIASIVV